MSNFTWLATLNLPIAIPLFCTVCVVIFVISKRLATRAAFNAFQASINLTLVKGETSTAALSPKAVVSAARACDKTTNNNKVDISDAYGQRAAAHLHPGQHRVQLFDQPQPYNYSTSSSSSSSIRRKRSGIPPPSSSVPVAVPPFPSSTLKDQFGDDGLVRVVCWNVERGRSLFLS